MFGSLDDKNYHYNCVDETYLIPVLVLAAIALGMFIMTKIVFSRILRNHFNHERYFNDDPKNEEDSPAFLDSPTPSKPPLKEPFFGSNTLGSSSLLRPRGTTQFIIHKDPKKVSRDVLHKRGLIASGRHTTGLSEDDSVSSSSSEDNKNQLQSLLERRRVHIQRQPPVRVKPLLTKHVSYIPGRLSNRRGVQLGATDPVSGPVHAVHAERVLHVLGRHFVPDLLALLPTLLPEHFLLLDHVHGTLTRPRTRCTLNQVSPAAFSVSLGSCPKCSPRSSFSCALSTVACASSSVNSAPPSPPSI